MKKLTLAVLAASIALPTHAMAAKSETKAPIVLPTPKAGKGQITTEITEAGPFYFAEGYHQGYLAKNPNGYCGIGGTGVVCPIGVGVDA